MSQTDVIYESKFKFSIIFRSIRLLKSKKVASLTVKLVKFGKYVFIIEKGQFL